MRECESAGPRALAALKDFCSSRCTQCTRDGKACFAPAHRLNLRQLAARRCPGVGPCSAVSVPLEVFILHKVVPYCHEALCANAS